MSRRGSLAVLCAAALLAPAASAQAVRPPVMPLSDVRPGMSCTVSSVLRGTAISTFSARIDDVVGAGSGARILLTVSGPAIDATGVGPGFSGSPVACPDPGGGPPRIAGAISETVGAFGGFTVLATPIEAILGEPVDPPAPRAVDAGARARRAQVLAAARPIAAPVSVTGLTPALGRALERAAGAAGGRRLVLAAPAAAPGAAPAPDLRPGSAVAVTLATGDIAVGAVGTLAFRDGDVAWAFGHPFEGAGRRNLFLTPAYVHAVIANPNATGDASTYKLASPAGPVAGTLRQDGLAAVVARLGGGPPAFGLEAQARDLDTGATSVLRARVADERTVGFPAGYSALSAVAPLAAAQALTTRLGGSPVRQTATLCLRVSVAQRRAPLGFCNRYVGAGGAPEALLNGPAVADVATAAGILDAYDATALTTTGARIEIDVTRGLRLGTLTSLRGPRRAARGSTIRVRAGLRLPGGRRIARTFGLRVPRGMPRGVRDILLTGTPADSPDSEDTLDLSALFGGSEEETAAPGSVRALASQVHAVGRWDGLSARFLRPGARVPEEVPGGAEGVAQRARRAFRDPQVRIAGSARLRILVR